MKIKTRNIKTNGSKKESEESSKEDREESDEEDREEARLVLSELLPKTSL